MNSIMLEITTPDKSVIKDSVESVVLPALTGELGILPGHSKVIVALKSGNVRVENAGKCEFFAVAGGVAQVSSTKVVVLTEKIS